jgi:hypothetical protein
MVHPLEHGLAITMHKGIYEPVMLIMIFYERWNLRNGER